jgi:predicted dehydrogenase
MAVVGVGYFGTLHAQKIAALPDATLVAVCDILPERAGQIGEALGVPGVTDCRSLIGEVDAVTIAVPTAAHFEVARLFLDAGVHVLIEKPMTGDVERARALIEMARRRGVILQVGHLPRFCAALPIIRGLLDRPAYIETDRIAPFKPRGTDVNVILDLMIHDIDLVLSLVNEPVADVEAIGTPVLSDSEDVANARIKFASGCVAVLTASRVGTKAERKMRIFQPDCYMGVDFLAGTVRIARRQRGPDDPGLEVREESFTDSDDLAAEIAAFAAAVASGSPPRVNGEDGLRALEMAYRINRCISGA